MTATQDCPIFEYGHAETQHLKNACPKMAAAIDEIGFIQRPIIPDLYAALVNSIVAQQISTKALTTVWARMVDTLAPITPQHWGSLPAETLQARGISMRKASYIKEMTDRVLSGQLDLNALAGLPDEEVCRKLCDIKGIGVWTAEMLMTFSMQRPDIMSFGDLAIHRGLRMLHRHRAITPQLFEKYKRRYSPYGSVASLYLWAIASGSCPQLTDPAPKKAPKKGG